MEFLLTHAVVKCPDCGSLSWKHFDVTAVCRECTMKKYTVPGHPGTVTDFVRPTTEGVTEDDIRYMILELIKEKKT